MRKNTVNYTLNIDAQIKDLLSAVSTGKKALEGLSQGSKNSGLVNQFKSIEKIIDNIKDKNGQTVTSEGFFSTLKKQAVTSNNKIEDLLTTINKAKSLSTKDKISFVDEDEAKKWTKAMKAFKAYNDLVGKDALQAANDKKNKSGKNKVRAEIDFNKKTGIYNKTLNDYNTKQATKTQEKFGVNNLDDLKKELELQKKKTEELSKQRDITNQLYIDAKRGTTKPHKYTYTDANGESKTADLAADKRAVKESQELEVAIQRQIDAWEKVPQAVTKAEDAMKKAEQTFNQASNDFENDSKAVAELEKGIKELSPEELKRGFDALRTSAKDLGISLEGISLEGTDEDIANLQNRLLEFANGIETTANDKLQTFITALQQLKQANGELKDSIKENNDAYIEQNNQLEKSQAIVSRIQQFAGLAGAANILSRSIRKATQTIKELDAQMTEMAVVTDLNVGDYWQQLPEYTKRANELGVAIKDVYEASTLYYQQGLKTEEVTAVSTQTLKMMKIAGLSAEEATNKMTAALRGFNMEVNEVNAERVADVYSELAAITASDVDEISSAMKKTASLASNAGMEFETTAAFLSQIIETTRESAETAGTALKTVIARFQELKKDPAEIGEVDGEIIDANKIETALRSVNVALRDSNGQFRNLDDVFLELASKWDSLDTNTQRYIATIAAGSRQQSRFIAMMSDYQRTQELVTAANDSAGASNEQFTKTMESLEAKLNQLQNAWNTFVTSIADSSLIKATVDLGTQILNLLNKIADIFDKIGLGGTARIGMIVGAVGILDKAVKVFTASMQQGNGVLASSLKVGTEGIKSIEKALISLTKKRIVIKPIDASSWKESLEVLDNAREQQLNLLMAQQKYQESLKAGKPNLEAYNKAFEDSWKACEDYSKTIGFTDDQMLDMFELQQQGISISDAAIIATDKNTVAKTQEAIATVTASNATDMEKMAKIKGIGATEAAKIAQDNENISKGTSVGLTLTQSIANKFWTITTKLQTAATKLATKTNWKWVASLAASNAILFIIIGVIVILVFLIYLLVQAIKKLIANSPEGKLKSAAEATEQAKTAAEEAADSYKNLVDALDDIGDKYDQLEELTKGTKEWNQAVKEINDSVMNLIEQYPELAKFVSYQDGLLLIDEDSDAVQQIIDQYEARKNQTKARVYYAEANQAEAQANLDQTKQIDPGGINKFINKITGGLFTDSVVYNDKTIDDFIAQELANGAFDKYQDKDTWINAVYDAVSAQFGTDQANRIKSNLDTYYKLSTTNASKESAYAGIKLTAVQSVGKNYTDQEKNIMNNAITDTIIESIKTNEYKTGTARLTGWLFNNEERLSQDNEYNAWAIQQYGARAKAADNGKIIYYDSEGKRQIVESDTAKELYSQDKTSEKIVQLMQELPKILNNFTKQFGISTSEAINNALSDSEGGNLTQADLQQLTDDQLSKYYNSLTEEQKQLYGTEDNFIKSITQSRDIAIQAFDDVRNDLQQKGLASDLWSDQMTSGMQSALTDNIISIVNKSGEEDAQTIANSINEIYGTLSEEQSNNFITQLNALDWSSVESLDSFKSTLESIGIVADDPRITALIDNIKKYNGAVSSISWDTLTERLKNLSKVIKGINTGEITRTIDESTYEALIAMDSSLASQFQIDLEGNFVYLGTSMFELRDAIQDNTEAQLASKIATTEAQLTAIDTITSVVNSEGNEFTGTYLNGLDNPAQAKLLGDIVDELNTQFDDLNILDIDNLGNGFNIENLTAKEINKMLNDLLTTYNSKNLLQENLTTYQNSNNGLATQTGSIQQSRFDLQNARKNGQDWTGTRNGYINQLISAGIDEKTVQNYIKATDAMMALEKAGKTNTNTYTKLVSKVQEYEKTLSTIATQRAMKTAQKETANNLSELIKSYEATTDAVEQLQLAEQMGAVFGMQVTEDNMAAVAGLSYQFMLGNVEAGEQMLEYALDQIGYSAEEMCKLTAEGIEDVDAEIQYFVQLLQASGLGDFFGEGGTFQLDLSGFTNYAKESGIADDLQNQIKAWEDSYTWINNMEAQYNDLLRQREKLQRKYNRALENQNVSAEKLLEIQSQELSVLSAQADTAALGINTASAEIRQLLSEAQFADYASHVAIRNGQLYTINTDNTGWSEAQGSGFTTYVSRLQELLDLQRNYQDNLDEIQDAVDEIKDRGKSEYNDLLNRIQTALIQDRQDQIDSLSAINEAINDASSKITDKIQEQIDDERQARQNEKTEQDIEDKRRRLAYLQQDTSSGNRSEILSLQKEIEDAQESYQDQLVDQALTQLQKDNEKAAQQRETQIAILTSQLEYWQENLSAQQSEDMLNEALRSGSAFEDTLAGQLLAQYDKIAGMSATQLEDYKKELNSQVAAAEGWLVTNSGSLLNTLSEKMEYLIGEEGNVIEKMETNTASISQSLTAFGADVVTMGNTIAASIAEEQSAIKTRLDNIDTQLDTQDTVLNELIKKANEETDNSTTNNWVRTDAGVAYGEAHRSDTSENFEYIEVNGEKYVQATIGTGAGYYFKMSDATLIDGGRTLYWKSGTHKYRLNQYATGGLVSQTGPAWLDGTASSPELVLNAQDTENFIELKDILRQFIGRDTTSTNNLNGNNYYDVQIQVDSIDSDYDVELLADKIKDMIVEDATYRNVNAVTLIR